MVSRIDTEAAIKEEIQKILKVSADRYAQKAGFQSFGAERIANLLNEKLNPRHRYTKGTVHRLQNAASEIVKLTEKHEQLLSALCRVGFLWDEEKDQPYHYDDLVKKLGLVETKTALTAEDLIAQIDELPEAEYKKLVTVLSSNKSVDRPLPELLDDVRNRPQSERLLVIEAAIKPDLSRLGSPPSARSGHFGGHRLIAAEPATAYSCKDKSVGADMEILQELIRAELALRGVNLKEYAKQVRLSERSLRTLLEQGEFYGDRENILGQLARNLTHPDRNGHFYNSQDLETYCRLKNSPNGNGESHHVTNGAV